MSLVVNNLVGQNTGYKPLSVAQVTNSGRLYSIYSELNGWQIQANEAENDGELPQEERRAASNYYDIAKRTKEVVLCKLQLCSPSDNAKFRDHQILAAYDSSGNLQGVLVGKKMDKKGIAFKVDKLVTAFWNFSSADDVKKTKGAGTSLMQKVVSDMEEPKKAIFLEPTSAAKGFYEKIGFKTVAGWTPKEEGAVCGMALYPSDFKTLSSRVVNDLTCCNETALPPTNKHYLQYLPPELRVRVEGSRV